MSSVAHLFHWHMISFHYNTIAHWCMRIFPSWHLFQNYLVEEIGLLHLHPSMDSNFHFVINMKLVTLGCDCSVFQITCLICDRPIFVCVMLGQPVQSSSWLFNWPFANPLHHFLMSITLIMPSHYTSISWWWNLLGKTCFAHRNWLHRELCSIKFPVSLPLHISLSPERHMTEWLTDWLTVALPVAVRLLQVVPPTQK